jgi:hypothetical protein
VLQNVKLTHYLSTILTILSVGLGGEVAAGKAGTLPVSPAVLGSLIMALYAVNYVLGLLSPSVVPSTNLRAARAAKLVDAATIVCFVAIGGVILSACIKPPTPAQQAQDGEALVACVAQYWGLSVVAVAAACTGDVISVAEDGIADVELAVETATGTTTDGGAALSGNPSTVFASVYASDVEVSAHLTKLKAMRIAVDAGH